MQLSKLQQWKLTSSAYRPSFSGEQQSVVRYYISSLCADAAAFNLNIRSHWGIENHLHWTLDVVFPEDQSQKRAGHAAENFALITRMALNLLKAEKTTKLSMKNKRHKAAWVNNYVIKRLTQKT